MGALRHGAAAAPARWPERAAPAGPSSGGAALRSALVPGWGQWRAGRRARGLVMLSLTIGALALVAFSGLSLVRAFVPLPGWVTQVVGAVGDLPLGLLDRVLGADWTVIWRAVFAANLAVLLLRTWVCLDAARCASRTGPRAGGHSVLGSLAGSLAAAVVIAPHAGVVAAGYAARPLIAQVLAPPAGAASAAAGAAEAAAALESDSGRPLWDGTSRLNVLLLGTDRRPQEAAERPWGNSDTVLLISIDPASQSAAMISLPRDLFVPIPGVGPEKINAAYREGGPALSARVVGDLVGQPIHRWASVDVSAFARLIDAVGGVVVDVERPIRDDEYPAENYSIRRIHIPSGLQWLTGEEALWYARSRHGSNDFDRASRQQALLLSLKERARDRRTLSHLPALISSLADAIQTDISPREALALARLGGSSDLRSERLVLTPPVYGREIIRPNLYAIEPNVPRIRTAVAEAIASGGNSRVAQPSRTVVPATPEEQRAQGGSGPLFTPPLDGPEDEAERP